MQGLAQGWLVYRLTDSPFLLGFVAFANSAPSLLFMLPAGVLTDHLDRLRTFRASQITQALSALLIALSIYTGHIAVASGELLGHETSPIATIEAARRG